MNHSFNVLVLNILLHVSAFQNAIIRVSDMNMLRWCPMSRKSEKMGAVYCDIVGILLDEGAPLGSFIQ
jgi:hypothetical protein